MAKHGSPSVGFVLVDGFDVRPVTTDVGPAKKRSLYDDTTAVGDSWHQCLPVGVRAGTFAHKGFYDEAAGSVNELLAGQQQVSRVVCVGFEGNVIGKRFDGLAGAFSSTYERLTVRGKLHLATATYEVSGEAETGIILENLVAKTTTGNTEGADSQDNGASSANGGAGYLQVNAISGTGATIDVKVRHSTDDSTYADLVLFPQVLLADVRKAFRVAVAGTVNRHLAASWTIAGSSPSVTFMVGFVRNPA